MQKFIVTALKATFNVGAALGLNEAQYKARAGALDLVEQVKIGGEEVFTVLVKGAIEFKNGEKLFLLGPANKQQLSVLEDEADNAARLKAEAKAEAEKKAAAAKKAQDKADALEKTAKKPAAKASKKAVKQPKKTAAKAPKKAAKAAGNSKKPSAAAGSSLPSTPADGK